MEVQRNKRVTASEWLQEQVGSKKFKEELELLEHVINSSPLDIIKESEEKKNGL